MSVVDMCFVFFFKQKTAYEMRISDWSSDVCSSDLNALLGRIGRRIGRLIEEEQGGGGVMLARMAGTEFLIGLGSDTATARAAFIAHRLIDEEIGRAHV